MEKPLKIQLNYKNKSKIYGKTAKDSIKLQKINQKYMEKPPKIQLNYENKLKLYGKVARFLTSIIIKKAQN